MVALVRALLFAAAAMALGAAPVLADDSYPSRPVRVLVPYPPGGAVDIVARTLGDELAKSLGQSIIIENRPGAGSNVAAEAVVRAPADGYTLLSVSSANAISATFYEKLNFNFIRDITPVAGIIRGPLVMEVSPSVPVKTVLGSRLN